MKTNIQGPKTNLIFKGARALQNNPFDYLMQLNVQYPNIAQLYLLHKRILHINHPEYVKEVLQTNQKHYIKSSQYKPLKDVLGNGLITSENPIWAKQRKTMQPVFHKQSINQLFDIMDACVDALVARLKERIDQGETHINISQVFMDITLRIIAMTIINRSIDGEQNVKAISDYVRYFVRAVNVRSMSAFSLPLWIPTPSNLAYTRNRRALDQTIQTIISGRKNETAQVDLLSMLLEMRYEDGSSISDELLIDEIKTMILAGHETTAVSLSWLFYMLLQKPEVMSKLIAEVDAFASGKWTVDTIFQMPYLKNCFHEGMRVIPPVWFIGKQNVQETTVGEFLIPKNTDVFINIYQLHHHPDYWEKPDDFIPERWENDAKIYKHAYIPFAAGQRMCMGNHFALMEAYLIIAKMLQHFHFEAVNNKEPTKDAGVTLRMKEDFYIKVKHR